MNDNLGACVPVYYCFEDEHHKEFVFPQSVIAASTTAGRHEMIRFRSRLEAAQHVINLNADFKRFFAEHFRPAVFNVACFFIVGEALKMLIQKLRDAGDMPIEDVRRACHKYPYLKLSPESSGNFAIEPVEEAISVEGMALELKKIIGGLLEKLMSLENAANWGMSHILAWTLADCSNQEGLRNHLLALPPDQADDAIWKHAWCGKEFQGYFAQAVHHLGSEIAHFVLDAIDLNNKSVREIEILIGLRSSAYYLAIAGEAKHRLHPILQWATTEYAGLQSSEALAVADTLREGAWHKFSVERDRRRFINEEAKRRSREFDVILLTGTRLSALPPYDFENWAHCGTQAFLAGQEWIWRVDDSDYSLISNEFTTLDELDAMISLRQAIKASDLSLDAERVLYAKIQDHTRENAHTAIGISKERVAAAWRDLHRQKDKFFRFLSPFPPQKDTLQ